MPNWLQYNGVKRTEIAASRPNRQSDDHPDYNDCPALGVRFRKLDARDLKRK